MKAPKTAWLPESRRMLVVVVIVMETKMTEMEIQAETTTMTIVKVLVTQGARRGKQAVPMCRGKIVSKLLKRNTQALFLHRQRTSIRFWKKTLLDITTFF